MNPLCPLVSSPPKEMRFSSPQDLCTLRRADEIYQDALKEPSVQFKKEQLRQAFDLLIPIWKQDMALEDSMANNVCNIWAKIFYEWASMEDLFIEEENIFEKNPAVELPVAERASWLMMFVMMKNQNFFSKNVAPPLFDSLEELLDPRYHQDFVRRIETSLVDWQLLTPTFEAICLGSLSERKMLARAALILLNAQKRHVPKAIYFFPSAMPDPTSSGLCGFFNYLLTDIILKIDRSREEKSFDLRKFVLHNGLFFAILKHRDLQAAERQYLWNIERYFKPTCKSEEQEKRYLKASLFYHFECFQYWVECKSALEKGMIKEEWIKLEETDFQAQALPEKEEQFERLGYKKISDAEVFVDDQIMQREERIVAYLEKFTLPLFAFFKETKQGSKDSPDFASLLNQHYPAYRVAEKMLTFENSEHRNVYIFILLVHASFLIEMATCEKNPEGGRVCLLAIESFLSMVQSFLKGQENEKIEDMDNKRLYEALSTRRDLLRRDLMNR